MYWHAEITLEFSVLTAPGQWFKLKELALRGYLSPGGFARHEDFIAVAKAYVFEADHTAFLQAALRKDGSQLQRMDYQNIATLLHTDFGVTLATADRHGKTVEFDAQRWVRKSATPCPPPSHVPR